MKTFTATYKPELKTFLQYFAVMLCFLSFVTSVLYLVFNKGESVSEYARSVAFLFFFLPLFNAASFAFASRKHQLTISEVSSTTQVADWTVKLLQKNGLRIKAVVGNKTILESGRKLMRACGNWFGAEMVEVQHTQDKVIVTGHSRYVDIPNSSIRFGNAALHLNS